MSSKFQALSQILNRTEVWAFDYVAQSKSQTSIHLWKDLHPVWQSLSLRRTGKKISTGSWFQVSGSWCWTSPVIVLLEYAKFQVSCRLEHVFFKDCPVFGSTDLVLIPDQFSSPWWWIDPLQDDATTTMLHTGDSVLRVIRSFGFLAKCSALCQHLSCGSLQVFQSYLWPLGCFSD